MNKRYLSEAQIVELVKAGNEIVPQSDYKQLQKIGKRWGIVLDSNRQANLQLWWETVKQKLDQLPAGDPFRNDLERAGKWNMRLVDLDLIHEFIRYQNAWPEYALLCDPKWHDLERFTANLRFLGCEPRGAEFLKSSGDYAGFFEKYSKKHCDPQAIKRSAKLRAAINTLFEDMADEGERLYLSQIVMQIASKPKMQESEFHNLIYTGQ